MLGWLAETAGATISGVPLIWLVAWFVGRNAEGFDGPRTRAFKGVSVGWFVVAIIVIWLGPRGGLYPLIGPAIRLPSAVIVFLILSWRYKKAETDRDDLNSFQ